MAAKLTNQFDPVIIKNEYLKTPNRVVEWTIRYTNHIEDGKQGPSSQELHFRVKTKSVLSWRCNADRSVYPSENDDHRRQWNVSSC